MVTGDLSGLEGELVSGWRRLQRVRCLDGSGDARPARGDRRRGRLLAARELLEADLLALDLACSRFRADSELVAVGNAARGASGPVTVSVSPLLAEAVAVSLRAAQLTDGDVDPTVGGALADLGYDRDFAELAAGAGRDLAVADGQ